MFISPSFRKMAQAEYCFMPFRQCSLVHFVNFRKTVFTSMTNQTVLVEYLQRKLLPANFLSYDIESASKKCIYWNCGLKQ